LFFYLCAFTYDKYTFVEVPRENADAVLNAMKDVKIKGKNIHMEKATGNGNGK
ncbi:MAG: DbpA RNA binding domain-containing protein, partial [Hungatella sp.]